MPTGWFYVIPIMVVFMLVMCLLCARMCMRHMCMGGDRTQETALDVLKRRYASGEVSKEQYEQMKGDITG